MIQLLNTSKLPLYLVIMSCLLLFACSGDSNNNDIPGTDGEVTQTSDTNASVGTSPVSPASIPLLKNGELTIKRLVKEELQWLSLSSSDWTRNYVYEGEKIVEIRKVAETVQNQTDETVMNFEYDGELLSRVLQRIQYGNPNRDTWTGEYTLNYEAGHLVEINTAEGIRHEYRYNEVGQIIGSLGGKDYFYFRDCGVGLPPETYVPVFSLTYDDQGRIVFAETDDLLYRVKFEYDSIGRMFKISSGHVCEPDIGPPEYHLFFDLTYNELNQIIKVEQYDTLPGGSGLTSTRRFVYNEKGLLAQVVWEQTNEAYVYSYDEDGYLAKKEYFNVSTDLERPDYIHTYEYENKPCKVAYSANKATLIMMDINWTYYVYDPHYYCDYFLDHFEYLY